MILRIPLFIFLVFVAVIAPAWILLICAILYAYKYTAYELFALAACMDAFYSSGSLQIPYYILVALCVIFFAEWLKPRIFMYNQ